MFRANKTANTEYFFLLQYCSNKVTHSQNYYLCPFSKEKWRIMILLSSMVTVCMRVRGSYVVRTYTHAVYV